jgi:hypothetical protein
MLNPAMTFDSDPQADLLTLHHSGLIPRGARSPLTMAVLIAVGLALVGCTTASPTSSTAAGGTATVKFVAPEKFTDLQLGGQSPEASRPIVLARFQSVIEQEAARRLPAGSTLEVRIIDVDQAGWIPPGNLYGYRVITDSRPARIELEYRRLAIGETNVVASPSSSRESVTLTSAGWFHTGSQTSADPLAVEDDLLRQWVRTIASHK